MRCMATGLDEFIHFLFVFAFSSYLYEKNAGTTKKSKPSSIVQNTDKQNPCIFEFNQKIPERLRRIRCFYNLNIPIFLIYEYYITKHFKKTGVFLLLKAKQQEHFKKQAFF